VHKLSLAAMVVASALATLATGSVAQTFRFDIPLAVVCMNSKTQTWVVGYLQTVANDGTAIYGRGSLTGTLNARGVMVKPSDRPALLDCYDKSLDQLRAEGRVLEFQRTK